MLSSVVNLLFDWFVAAPWWTEIFVAVILFWVGLAALTIILSVVYLLFIFFGVPVVFLLHIISGVLSLIIAIFKTIGLPSQKIESIKQGLQNTSKSCNKAMFGEEEDK